MLHSSQGFAFIQEYCKLRGDCPESQYNLARACHHIGSCPSSLVLARLTILTAVPYSNPGIHTHAIAHYKKVLDLVAASNAAMPLDGADEAEPTPIARALKQAQGGVAKAAAYNLCLLYWMTDRGELAREVAQRWLAV